MPEVQPPDVQLAIISDRQERMQHDINKILLAVEGDGNGSPGLRVRVINIERTIKYWGSIAIFIGSILGGVVTKAADHIFDGTGTVVAPDSTSNATGVKNVKNR